MWRLYFKFSQNFVDTTKQKVLCVYRNPCKIWIFVTSTNDEQQTSPGNIATKYHAFRGSRKATHHKYSSTYHTMIGDGLEFEEKEDIGASDKLILQAAGIDFEVFLSLSKDTQLEILESANIESLGGATGN